VDGNPQQFINSVLNDSMGGSNPKNEVRQGGLEFIAHVKFK
jgi:hypothetical protein